MAQNRTAYHNIIFEKENQIATITLNRPEKKNALSPELHNEMIDAITDLEGDDETRVVVITGAGDSFCAGQDLEKYFLENLDNPVARQKAIHASISWGRKLRTLSKPTIARVNGWCFGAGIRILGLCDLAIASQRAVFGLSEINFAHIPASGSMWVPAYHLHPRDVLYLAMTGERIDAKEAEIMRLVNRSVPHETLDSEIKKLANTLREKDPIALAACKQTYRLARRLDYDDSVEWELAKVQEKNYLQKGSLKDALSGFVDKKYKPGFEAYRSRVNES